MFQDCTAFPPSSWAVYKLRRNYTCCIHHKRHCRGCLCNWLGSLEEFWGWHNFMDWKSEDDNRMQISSWSDCWKAHEIGNNQVQTNLRKDWFKGYQLSNSVSHHNTFESSRVSVEKLKCELIATTVTGRSSKAAVASDHRCWLSCCLRNLVV